MKENAVKIFRIFGYIVAIIVIIVGVAMVAGLLLPENIPENFRLMMGIVFILYGIYRIVILKTKYKKIQENGF